MTMKQIIMSMIEKCHGGKTAVAAFLGMSEQSFNNRLYQTKGQKFSDEELIAIETEYGVSDWSDEVNRRLGKVSFIQPNKNELDTVEISRLQMQDQAANGSLYIKLDEFVRDGHLTQNEQEVLRQLLYKAQQTKAALFESVIVLYSK
ncbi:MULTISPECIES: YmfL family putative regulatory protein [Glaesserella]|uniref:Uncharacterized protein n=1 Tax=Glaesserella australis TaxID=2094024 RepID=A0A328BYF7_9PAST|nr:MULTISPECIES: YmfL family putative regulatory protein [Glaesserella]AUI65604.1 hypothetical protein CJD39_03005 [Glaesserella sp. 15-184]RAL19109.1 hypothetical protein C5N92_04760 [Glaesserella australis]